LVETFEVLICTHREPTAYQEKSHFSYLRESGLRLLLCSSLLSNVSFIMLHVVRHRTTLLANWDAMPFGVEDKNRCLFTLLLISWFCPKDGGFEIITDSSISFTSRLHRICVYSGNVGCGTTG